MPAQDKLIRKLQDNPPGDFAELESLMQECGYGITVTDPKMGMDEDPEDMGPMEGARDMDESEAEAEEAMEEMDDLMGGMLPPPMAEGNDLSPKGRGKMRIKVAKFALADDKKKRESKDE
tara:strand:+ start:494 stop:853 length:360 start_codon:yes stop_codon:yes gene_type:complete